MRKRILATERLVAPVNFRESALSCILADSVCHQKSREGLIVTSGIYGANNNSSACRLFRCDFVK